MKYNLVYPLDGLKNVNVGIFTGAVIRLASDINKVKDGSFFSELLAKVSNIPLEQTKDLSLIDAKQIIGLSWQQTYEADAFTTEVVCQCGQRLEFVHQVVYDIKPSDKFGKLIDIGRHKVLLRSPTVERELKLLASIHSEDTDVSNQMDITWSNSVLSVDGVSAGYDNLSMKLVHDILNIVKEENKTIEDMVMQTKKCKKCGAEVISVFNIMEQNFLAPRHLV